MDRFKSLPMYMRALIVAILVTIVVGIAHWLGVDIPLPTDPLPTTPPSGAPTDLPTAPSAVSLGVLTGGHRG